MALTQAFSDARRLVKKTGDQRRWNRDAVLAAWINATPPGEERVIVRCSGRSCPQDQKEQILDRLVAYFERMPAFLKGSGLKQVRWNQLLPGDRPDGMGMDGNLSLLVPPDAPVDLIIVHELAHLYFEVHAQDVEPFLALRFKTEDMRRKIETLACMSGQAS